LDIVTDGWYFDENQKLFPLNQLLNVSKLKVHLKQFLVEKLDQELTFVTDESKAVLAAVFLFEAVALETIVVAVKSLWLTLRSASPT
jgi:hypothetical protein